MYLPLVVPSLLLDIFKNIIHIMLKVGYVDALPTALAVALMVVTKSK